MAPASEDPDTVDPDSDDEHDPEDTTIAFERAQVTELLRTTRVAGRRPRAPGRGPETFMAVKRDAWSRFAAMNAGAGS